MYTEEDGCRANLDGVHCRCRYQYPTFVCNKYEEREREREKSEREVYKDNST